MSRSRLCHLVLLPILAGFSMSVCRAATIDLTLLPMSAPELSSVSVSVIAGALGSSFDSSPISGHVTLELDPLQAPRLARVTGAHLVVDEALDFRLATGLVTGGAQPGAVTMRLVEAGLAGNVSNNTFDQFANLVGFEGMVSFSLEPEPIDLAELEVPVDFVGMSLTTSGGRATLQASIDLQVTTMVDGGPLGEIPVTFAVSGGLTASGLLPAGSSVWNGDDPTAGMPGDGVHWNDASNWTRNGLLDAPFVPGDAVFLAARSAQRTIDLHQDQNVQSIAFASDYTLVNHTLVVESGEVVVGDNVTATIHSNLSGPAGLVKSGEGTLRLSASAGDTVVNEGGLAGRATLASLTLSQAAALRLRIDGNEPTAHDQLVVVGRADLHGALELEVNRDGGSYENPEVRGQTDRFTLLASSELAPQLARVSYDGVPLDPVDGGFRAHVGSGLFRRLWFDGNTIQFENYLAIPGDTDGDHEVTFSDFVRLADHFAAAGGWLDGDFDGSGQVQFPDFVLLSENFGQSAESVGQSAAAVPEPSTPLIWAVILAMRRRQRRGSLGRNSLAAS